MRTQEQKREYARNWYQQNIERERQKRSSYNKGNRSLIRIWERSYHKTPDGYYRHLKKKARLRGIPFEIEKQDFSEWFLAQEHQCCYCSRPLIYDRELGSSPSVDRKDNALGYTLMNICLSCVICNNAKNKYFTFDEMKIIGRAINAVLRQKGIC